MPLALVERNHLTKPTAGNGCGFFVTLAEAATTKKENEQSN
jgi:hypothetical protein